MCARTISCESTLGTHSPALIHIVLLLWSREQVGLHVGQEVIWKWVTPTREIRVWQTVSDPSTGTLGARLCLSWQSHHLGFQTVLNFFSPSRDTRQCEGNCFQRITPGITSCTERSHKQLIIYAQKLSIEHSMTLCYYIGIQLFNFWNKQADSVLTILSILYPQPVDPIELVGVWWWSREEEGGECVSVWVGGCVCEWVSGRVLSGWEGECVSE